MLEDFRTIPEIKHLNKNEQDKLKGWLLYKIAGQFDIDHELNEIVRDKNVKLIWKSIHNSDNKRRYNNGNITHIQNFHQRNGKK